METSIFFFSQPAAGLTNQITVRDSRAGTLLEMTVENLKYDDEPDI